MVKRFYYWIVYETTYGIGSLEFWLEEPITTKDHLGEISNFIKKLVLKKEVDVVITNFIFLREETVNEN